MVDHTSPPTMTPLVDNGDFVTREGVPVFDEHEGSDGTVYDRYLLEKIADNCNERIRRSGDFCPLTLQHTHDDPTKFDPEVVGCAGNFRVAPVGEDRAAIVCDFHYYKSRAGEVLKRYPRRSVEIWGNDPEKRFFDPIALLGATTPRRDLGLSYASPGGPIDRYEMEMGSSAVAPGGNNTYIPGATGKSKRKFRSGVPDLPDLPGKLAGTSMGEQPEPDELERDYPETDGNKPSGMADGEGRRGVQPNANPLDAMGEQPAADRPPPDQDFDPSMLQGPLPPEALQQIATLVRSIVAAETSALTRPIEDPEPAMPPPDLGAGMGMGNPGMDMETPGEAGMVEDFNPGQMPEGGAYPTGPPEPPAPAMGPFDTPEAGLPEAPDLEGFDPKLLQEGGRPGQLMGMGAPPIPPGQMMGQNCGKKHYYREEEMNQSPADRYQRERDEWRDAYDAIKVKLQEFTNANSQWRDRYAAVVKERDELKTRVQASEKEAQEASRRQQIVEKVDKYQLACDVDAECKDVASFTKEQFSRHLERMEQYQRQPVGDTLPTPAGERPRPAPSLDQAREKYAAVKARNAVVADRKLSYGDELKKYREEAKKAVTRAPEPEPVTAE